MMSLLKFVGGAGAVGLVAIAASGGTHAQEYCVACTGPEMMYRCKIEDARPGGGQSLQAFCLRALQKDGGHANCTIQNGTVFDCKGPLKRIPYAAANEPIPAPLKQEKPKSAEPRTLVDAIEQAKQKGPEVAKRPDAMAAPAPAPRPSDGSQVWQCLTSFFVKC
jgi:hypothetical protein